MERRRIQAMRNNIQDYTAIKKSRGGFENSYTKFPVNTERLKKLIDESNYSIAQLSRMVSSKSNSLLYHWYDGTVKYVRYEYAIKTCELLNVPFEYLFHPVSDTPDFKTKKRSVPYSENPETKRASDLVDDLEEIKKLLISINNGIANLCKKWE